MVWFRVFLCLLVTGLAACSAVRDVPPASPPASSPPASSPPASSPTHLPTTSPDAVNVTPLPQPTPSAAVTVTPAGPVVSPTPEPRGPTATPIPAARSWKKPWQYFSGGENVMGAVIYRLRYPKGWFAGEDPGGEALLLNIPSGDDRPGSPGPGVVRLQITFTHAAVIGGLPGPNQKPVAAGRPGTRQILVDAGQGITVWNVRLYGLNESSTTMNLTGYLAGSKAEIDEGIRLLDAILATLELYAWPDPTPTLTIPDHTIADDWQVYEGRLAAHDADYQVRFRFPRGWWAYPYENRFVDVTNYFVDPFNGQGGPSQPGRIKLSVSVNSCAEVGGCPERPQPLANGVWRGDRTITTSPEGDTFWTVRIYHEQVQFTLFAILGGSEQDAARGVQTLNMILRTLEIFH